MEHNLDISKIQTPYHDQWEILDDALYWLDLRISILYEKHAWLGIDNNMQQLMGVVVSRDEFEQKLSNASEMYTDENVYTNDEEVRRYIQARLNVSNFEKFPLIRLIDSFHMDVMEIACLLTALAIHIDEKYTRIFAYLQDDITKKIPSIRLTIALCAFEKILIAKAEYALKKSTALSYIMNQDQLQVGELKINDAIFDYIFKDQHNGYDLKDDYLQVNEKEFLIVKNIIEDNQKMVVLLCGEKGSGRKSVVKRALDGKKRLLEVEVKDVASFKEDIDKGVVKALLSGDVLCICFNGFSDDNGEFSSVLKKEIDMIPNELYPIFIIANESFSFDNAAQKKALIRLKLNKTTNSEREKLFSYYTRNLVLDEDVDLSELAAKFVFTCGRICDAMNLASGIAETEKCESISSSLLHRACYDILASQSTDLTYQKTTSFEWDDLVLPKSQKTLMIQACQQVKYTKKVYEEWGFEKKAPYGRGVSILLSGPPGTGKTMSASIIAAQLKMKLQIVQISKIVSKYVGETEKNLSQVFDQATKSSSILFFDECDALFGKRSEVKDAQDRHANVEVAFLLQQMEAYDGVTILATNLLNNIDSAFMRRMRFVIHFPFPDKATRAMLFRKTISRTAPIEDNIDFDFLADKFPISGGNIKNVVLHAAFLAAADDMKISMSHMLFAAVSEQRKNEIIIVKEDLREYADLLDIWQA